MRSEPSSPASPSIADQLQRADAFRQAGQWWLARSAYEEVLDLAPRTFVALYWLGLIAAQSRDPVGAAALFGRAVDIEPEHAMAHGNRGAALTELRRWPEALASLDRAIALNPEHAAAYSNRGNVLKELQRWQDALASYDRAIAIKPELAEVHCNRANVLVELKQWEAALASCDRAIALNPALAGAWLNRGIVLRELKQPDAALASYDRAITVDDGYAEAYSDRGMVLEELHQMNHALESYDKAILLAPDFAEAHFNRAMVLLSCGDFERGWLDYEWRREKDGRPAVPNRAALRQTRWDGSQALAGKTILVHCEQGLGDTLQFCRYAACVAARGARVVLEVQKPLARLLAGLDGVAELVTAGAELVRPDVDYHCPLMSLPLAFKTTLDTIPDRGRYLWSDHSTVMQWDARLGPKRRPRVGLMWSGNAAHRQDRDRSVGLADLVECLPSGIQYVSLQKEVRARDLPTLKAHPDLWDFSASQKDFADAAALCECMDLVISVDTSVAHLSAALGRPTWILLAYHADWRWLLDREDSPWYASVKLHRQAKLGDWRGVFDRVAADLMQHFGLGADRRSLRTSTS